MRATLRPPIPPRDSAKHMLFRLPLGSWATMERLTNSGVKDSRAQLERQGKPKSARAGAKATLMSVPTPSPSVSKLVRIQARREHSESEMDARLAGIADAVSQSSRTLCVAATTSHSYLVCARRLTGIGLSFPHTTFQVVTLSLHRHIHNIIPWFMGIASPVTLTLDHGVVQDTLQSPSRGVHRLHQRRR
jgi:hypothetical protein